MKIKLTFRDKVSSSLIVVILMIFSLQNSFLIKYHSLYSLLGFFSLIILFILFFIKKNNIIPFTKDKIFVTLVFLFLFQLIIAFCLKGFGEKDNISYCRDVIMIISFVFLGYSEKNYYSKYMFYFTIFLSLSALTIIFFVAGGLTISATYLTIPKNQIAPIFVLALISGIFYLNNSKREKIKKYFILSAIAILIITIVILRGRTAMLALALCMILYAFYYIKNIKKKITFFILITLVVCYFSTYIYNAFFLNYDINESDSLTSGRTSVYEEAIEIIADNPLTGILFQNSKMSSQVHNYILSIYLEFGIFSLPLLIIYIIFLYLIYKMIRLRKISGLLLLVLFITSLSEYTFPFAPGSVTFFAFFLLGIDLKSDKTKNKLTYKKTITVLKI